MSTDDPKPAPEPKDQRIPIMMSASEVKAIDDWGFARRVRTRAEAIRRLCALGLANDPEKIADHAARLTEAFKPFNEAVRLLNRDVGPNDLFLVLKQVHKAQDMVHSVTEEIISSLYSMGAAFTAADDLIETQKKMKTVWEDKMKEFKDKEAERRIDAPDKKPIL